jgi:hypothetical protein
MSDVCISSIDSYNSSNPLIDLLFSNNITPGDPASYELCKMLWVYHPLCGKLVEKSVKLSLSKKRKITVDAIAKEILVDAFEKEWDRLNAINYIRDTMFVTRAYGVGAIVYGDRDIPTDKPIDPFDLPFLNLYFNVFDPLNMAGSIVTNQNPNAPDFQKPLSYITAAGQPYHPSRTRVMYNGTPIYLQFESSTYGFTGRSVFQRALYPLKSFIQTMITDDWISLKAGLIIAKNKPSGAVVTNLMDKIQGLKRSQLQQGTTGNILNIDVDESIESIDLNNTALAITTVRDNIITNVATASDVPAMLIKDEAFTQGFGEGTEDAKAVMQHVEGIRGEMASLFDFFTDIVMHRAWNEDVYESIKDTYPEVYSKMTYKQAFYSWKNAFRADWPTLLDEPMSEKVKTDEIKLNGLIEFARTLLPIADPDNKARIVGWMTDNLADMKDTFHSVLDLDLEELAKYTPLGNVSC